MEGRLAGRIAAVIGGGSGMGRACAARFAAEGATVYVADIDEDAAAGVAAEITDRNGSATPVGLDACNTDELTELYSTIEQRHGKLHVLHNQVGTPGPAGMDVSARDWQQSIDVNMKSAFYAFTLAFDLLKKADGVGSAIFVASTSALVGSPSSPLYSFTKGGLLALTKSLALAGAPHGIRVNVICPAAIDTPMLPAFFARVPGADVQQLMSDFVREIPLQRMASCDEVAGVVSFLACDDSSFVTGVTIPIDGGLTAK